MALSESSLKLILSHIQKEQCVIFLGDELAANKEGKFLKNIAYDFFAQENPDTKLDLDIDKFYFFNNEISQKSNFATQMVDFLEENDTPLRLHKLIACINFPLIISLTPDKIMHNAFPSGVAKSDYYYYKREPTEIEKIDSQHPLVYNLFGSIEDTESLLLTTDDLLEYLFAIIGGGEEAKRPIHSEVKTVLSKAKYFIFLGFDLDKWYIRILFKYFDIRSKGTGLDHYIGNPSTKNFYMNNFKVGFLDASPEEIMNAIYKKAVEEDSKKSSNRFLRFKLSEQEELVPIKSVSESDIVEEFAIRIKTFIGKANLAEAFIAFEKMISLYKKEYQNELILLQSQYNNNENRWDKNLISNANYEMEKSRITQALLNLIDLVNVTE